MSEAINKEQQGVVLRGMADFFEKTERNPITKTPKEVGLEFKEISFKTEDNINLKAWYIPSTKSKKLVVFNHFMLGKRDGAVPLEGWGNITVDFMPIYKHLVDAGYNIFTYDLRNHGASDVHENGKLGLTTTEYKDVIAATKYAKENYPDNDLYLFSQCYGTVATIRAIDESPALFKDIRAFINIQPLELAAFVEGISKTMNIWDKDSLSIFENQLEKVTGCTFADIKMPAQSVHIPTLTVQVKKDFRTTTASIEKIHDQIGTDDKKLFWIEDTEERLEGYNYFGREPKEMIEWFDKH
jgi:hypothetical protein